MRKLTAVLIIVAAGISIFTFNILEKQSNNILPLIRLHIIANSDNKADQAIKYEIRDAIIKYLEPKFKDVKNLTEARKIIISEKNTFEAIAKDILSKNKRYYSVAAYHGTYSFPPRNYGAIFLPAGEYEALRVVLGEGDGKNWWCVLFPPLCLIKETGYDFTKEQTTDSQEIMIRSKIWEILKAN